MKITAYNDELPLVLSGAGGIIISNNSRTALGSNTPLIESGAGSPGSGPQAAAWDHVHPEFGGGGASSFGSNSTRVSSVSGPGASSSNSRADHVHDGIGTITASSSNTLVRGTVNLRPGTGIAFDLNAGLDTLTIQNIASGGSGGGGGGGPSDYVSGASGTGHIIIPGILVADRVPASPSANDDEFDTTDTSDPMTGWTTLQTLDSLNINSDAASHLHMAKTATGTLELYGVYKAIPSMPFTVTAKLSDAILGTNFARAGLMLLEAAPGKAFEFGLHITTAGVYNMGYGLWTNANTRSSFTNLNVQVVRCPIYLRMVVASSTSITTSYSTGGLEPLPGSSAVNPGFTIGNVGLFISGEDNSVAAGAYFDWIRFT